MVLISYLLREEDGVVEERYRIKGRSLDFGVV